jgi:hypothetical protein
MGISRTIGYRAVAILVSIACGGYLLVSAGLSIPPTCHDVDLLVPASASGWCGPIGATVTHASGAAGWPPVRPGHGIPDDRDGHSPVGLSPGGAALQRARGTSHPPRRRRVH